MKFRLLFCLLLFSLFASGQDTLRLPPGYQPWYNWDTIPDTTQMKLRAEFPKRWQDDSLYYAFQNKLFLDSLLDESILKQSLYYPQLPDTVVATVSPTNLPPDNSSKALSKPVPLWLYWVILFILVSLVFLKYTNMRFFNLLFLSFINPAKCDEALREHDTPVNIYNLIATLLYSLIYAVFLWLVVVKTGWIQIHPSATVSFILVFMAIAVFYMIRYLFIMLAGAVFDAEYTYGVLVQVTVSGNVWVAVVVIPAIAILNAAWFHFTSPLLPVYFAGAALLYLLAKQVRVFIQVFNSFPHSIVYLILYLCALEIAPYLAIFKLIIQQSG